MQIASRRSGGNFAGFTMDVFPLGKPVLGGLALAETTMDELALDCPCPSPAP
jgi:hypothetical protein